MTKVSTAQGVIDEIDALIDEQMRGGEPETGYDFDDPGFPECRCGLNWHGLPTLVCPGSDTEGPLQLPGLVFGRWPDVPSGGSISMAGDVVLVHEHRQWPTSLAEEFPALAQAVERTRQQFVESWSRLVETLVWGPAPLEFERLHLDRWVASHDWQAETREEPELPDVVSTTAIRTTLEDLGQRDIRYTTNTPWANDGVTRSRRRARRP